MGLKVVLKDGLIVRWRVYHFDQCGLMSFLWYLISCAMSLFNNGQFNCFIIKIPMHIYVESDSTQRRLSANPELKNARCRKRCIR
jgi:hypothetical protein